MVEAAVEAAVDVEGEVLGAVGAKGTGSGRGFVGSGTVAIGVGVAAVMAAPLSLVSAGATGGAGPGREPPPVRYFGSMEDGVLVISAVPPTSAYRAPSPAMVKQPRSKMSAITILVLSSMSSFDSPSILEASPTELIADSSESPILSSVTVLEP